MVENPRITIIANGNISAEIPLTPLQGIEAELSSGNGDLPIERFRGYERTRHFVVKHGGRIFEREKRHSGKTPNLSKRAWLNEPMRIYHALEKAGLGSSKLFWKYDHLFWDRRDHLKRKAKRKGPKKNRDCDVPSFMKRVISKQNRQDAKALINQSLLEATSIE